MVGSRADGFGNTAPGAVPYVTTGTIFRQPRLTGAQILLRPAPGLTKEIIQRGLECHEAAVTLGRTAPTDADPYVLPHVWLEPTRRATASSCA